MVPVPRNLRPPREVRPLEVEPLVPVWTDGDVVRALVRYLCHTPVVAVGGSLDAAAALPCRRALDVALRARPRYVVIDLAAVTSSDAVAVPLLDAMRRTAAWHGAQLWLAALPDHVQTALEHHGAVDQFPTERTAARAVDAITLRARARQHHSQTRTA